MASRNHCFIAKSDIVFLGKLERRFLSSIITSVIGYTMLFWDCFTDSHLCHRSSDEVDGKKYILKHFLSSGIVVSWSGVSVLNISNWSATLLLQ
jgi:hypothetical protein